MTQFSAPTGLIGEITTLFTDHGQHLYPDGPDRLADLDIAGGALLDLAVYPISFADFVLGPFTAITATSTLTDRGVDQQEAITWRTRRGALGMLHASMLATSLCTASICGTDGRLDIGGTFYLPSWVQLYDRDGTVIDRYYPSGDAAHQGLRYEAAEAARCLTVGATQSPLHPLATMLRVMDAMDEAPRQLGVRFPHELRTQPQARGARPSC